MSKGSSYVFVEKITYPDICILIEIMKDFGMIVFKPNQKIDFWDEKGEFVSLDEKSIFDFIEKRRRVGFSLWINQEDDCFFGIQFGDIDLLRFSFDGLSKHQENLMSKIASKFLFDIPNDRGLFVVIDKCGEFERRFFEDLL